MIRYSNTIKKTTDCAVKSLSILKRKSTIGVMIIDHAIKNNPSMKALTEQVLNNSFAGIEISMCINLTIVGDTKAISITIKPINLKYRGNKQGLFCFFSFHFVKFVLLNDKIYLHF
jgi:hypothetical protein